MIAFFVLLKQENLVCLSCLSVCTCALLVLVYLACRSCLSVLVLVFLYLSVCLHFSCLFCPSVCACLFVLVCTCTCMLYVLSVYSCTCLSVMLDSVIRPNLKVFMNEKFILAKSFRTTVWKHISCLSKLMSKKKTLHTLRQNINAHVVLSLFL